MFNMLNSLSSETSQWQSQALQQQTSQMQMEKQLQQFENAKTNLGIDRQNAQIDLLKSVRL